MQGTPWHRPRSAKLLGDHSGARYRRANMLVSLEPDAALIAERLSGLRARIAAAAARAGRRDDEVLLLAVSKTKPASAVRAAYAAGQRDFGENYVQELAQKADALKDLADLRWHAIGRLQRNKARDVARWASVVHAIDRFELAEELDRRASKLEKRLSVLVEVNVAGEGTKGGCSLDEAPRLIDQVRALSALELVGLTTIAPDVDDPEQVRPVFASLRALARAHGLRELSMGMSNDFEVAIEEGSTLVRIGTAIFGARAIPGR